MTETGSAFHKDDNKPRTDLLPPLALWYDSKVALFGAGKYGDRNWEEHATSWKYGQLIGSTLRHILKWMLGEDRDEQSGLPHLSHARYNLGMLVELQARGLGTDDRTKLPYGGMVP